MAEEAKPPSTTDLLLLIAGLKVLKKPELKAGSGAAYYLNDPTTNEERTLRESLLNIDWILSPAKAWDDVRFRDWLIATLAGGIAGHKNVFTAINEQLLFSMDVLSKEFKPRMQGITPEITQILTTAKTNLERSFLSALSVGISRHVIEEREVFTVGAGMRRRATLFLPNDEELRADVEFYFPFYILPSKTHPKTAMFSDACAICAGIMVSKSGDHAIGKDGNDELIAAKANLRIPFRVHWASKTQFVAEDLHTEFGKPEINIQKRVKKKDAPIGDWENFAGWKDFFKTYCKEPEAADLLNAPIGPLLLGKVSDGSAIKDIILKQKKREQIKTDMKNVQEALDDTYNMLKSATTWEPPKRDTQGPHSSQRKLGSLLESLGFMTGKLGSGGEFDYAFEVASGVTPWKVVDALLNELDGFPLWIKGLDSQSDKSARIALSLAVQQNLVDQKKTYFGLAGLAYNIPIVSVPEKKDDKESEKKEEVDVKTPTIELSKDNFTDDKSILIDEETEQEESESGGGEDDPKPKPPEGTPPSTVEVLLHLGKWFSGESLDDNWFQRLLPLKDLPPKRRVPLPGIRILPVKRVRTDDNRDAQINFTMIIDLLSLGVDIQGTTKDGLTFLKGVAGHFGLGAVEVRIAIKISLEDIRDEKSFFDRVALGIGVKLRDLRLSFEPPEEEEKKDSGNEIIDGLQELLKDEWVVVPAPEKGPERKIKTRLSAKKKDKFSISFGYLTPLREGSGGTLDIQLYDEKGNRGKMALIPIDRFADPIYLRQIGIALKGVENIELGQGLPDSAQLTVALTGGFRLPVFEMGFIGAKLTFPLNNPLKFQLSLDGLDVSIKIGDVIISGSFMKVGIEYAGSLTVDVPKASFSAMGFYGPLRVFNMSVDSTMWTDLNTGKIPSKLRDKLIENKITPVSVQRGNAPGEWDLLASGDTRFTITDDEDKLNVLRLEKTFFIFAMLNAASGYGPTFGPIQFTGIAFGYGHNRKLKVPRIEKVAEFPLVQMVMGEGGFQKDDTSLVPLNQLGKPLEDPVSTLEKMKDHLVAERGSQFLCAGVRFNIAKLIDCFALLVVQWNEKEFEIALMGLARFRHTRDASAKPICYVEMQVLMTIKPSEGTFKLQALLTNNSWVLNTDCKLTGGFALFVWFSGEHAGDMVLTLGGYHPRFRRPEHYPIVPRLGLNWPVDDKLSIKGGVYLAITPSCLMVGGKLEATFHSGRISAWFTAYLDVIVNWHPLSFEADIGISLRVEAAFSVSSIKVTIGASIKMWGPPVGGIAHIDLAVVSFDIDFGTKRPEVPELIGTWEKFCHNFLNMSGGDSPAIAGPVKAFAMVQPNLAGGRNNLNKLPNTKRQDPAPKIDDVIWKVRADELEFAASAAVPVMKMNFGSVNAKTEGVQDRNFSGQPMMATKPLTLESSGLKTEDAKNAVGAHPMGKKLQSVLNVTVVRDELSKPQPVNLTNWTLKAETASMPAALWDATKPDLSPSEPSAKLIEGCITGVKWLKPPRGKLGKRAEPPKIEWHPLDPGKVLKSTTEQGIPKPGTVRNIQPVLAQKQAEQKKIVEACALAGFSLTWKPTQDVRFRELQADPLVGGVAA